MKICWGAKLHELQNRSEKLQFAKMIASVCNFMYMSTSAFHNAQPMHLYLQLLIKSQSSHTYIFSEYTIILNITWFQTDIPWSSGRTIAIFVQCLHTLQALGKPYFKLESTYRNVIPSTYSPFKRNTTGYETRQLYTHIDIVIEQFL